MSDSSSLPTLNHVISKFLYHWLSCVSVVLKNSLFRVMNVNLLNRNTSVSTLQAGRAVNTDQHSQCRNVPSLQPLQIWTDLSVLTCGLWTGSISAIKHTLGINILEKCLPSWRNGKIYHTRLIKENLFQHDIIGGMQILSGVT